MPADDVWTFASGVRLHASSIRMQIRTRLQRANSSRNLWEPDEEPFWRAALQTASALPQCASRGGTPLRHGDACTLLDMGAAYGYYSLLARQHGPPGLAVHAFNPHPLFMRELQRNLALNGRDGEVHLHELAIGGSEGAAEMDYAVGGGLNGSKHGHEHGRNTRRTVRVATLDEWAATVAPALLKRPPPFLFVKLDIEGAAAAALAGGRRLLRHATHVLVGIHNDDEWAAAREAFAEPAYEIVMAQKGRNGATGNGVFAARKRIGSDGRRV
tara:strand:- start:1358 stop:2170 length:813 start_codon:yes stop_codon:yes gene_type:complete